MAEHQDHGHEHGQTDVEDHEKTFEGFVKAVGYGCAICILVLIFLALVGA